LPPFKIVPQPGRFRASFSLVHRVIAYLMPSLAHLLQWFCYNDVMEGSERSFWPMRGTHCVSVQIFSDDLSRCFWANAGWGPTGTRITDSTESSLVLRHDNHRSRILWISGFQMFTSYFREFFLNSSWLSSLAPTCSGRGTILRHRCRLRSR